MKFLFYVACFSFLLISCKAPWEKALGGYQENDPTSMNNDTSYLHLNRRGICTLTTADTTFFGVWGFHDDTVTIVGLDNFNSLMYVRKYKKLHLLDHSSSDSLYTDFKKTNRYTNDHPNCGDIECVYTSLIKSADKLNQLGRSTGNVQLLNSAKRMYEEALAIHPQDYYSREMLLEINETIEHREKSSRNAELCIKLVSVADKSFEINDYAKAREFYIHYLQHDCSYDKLEHVNNRILLLDSLSLKQSGEKIKP